MSYPRIQLPAMPLPYPRPQPSAFRFPFQQQRWPLNAKPSIPSGTGSVAPSAVSAAKKATHTNLTPDQFTAQKLTQDDLDVIISKYGTEIEDIYDLAPGQSWMFGKAHKVTSAFFIQELIKVTLKLKPSTFRQRVDAMSKKRSNLRTAFSYRGQETPYQVVLKNRQPELRFVDRSDKTLSELEEELEQFRAADRRRGFDLERDSLLRITVFSTSEEDTYALILSQPHINNDGASEMMIYRELLLDYAVNDQLPIPEFAAGSYQDYAKYLQGIDREAELSYWEDLLSGSCVTRLPGRVHSSLEPAINNLELIFQDTDSAKIANLPGRYKATMNSIVQSAWGIMLQKIYGTEDAVFGTITSGRTSEVANSDTMTGGFVNAFPVRIRAGAGERFSDVVSRTQNQIFRSVQMAHCSPDEISERIGQEESVFDHLLNFHNFADTTQEMPAFPGLSILGMDCYDNLSTGFCLYFRPEKKGLNCIFSYDRRAFSERKVQLLADCFRQVLEQLLADDNGQITVGDLHCPDIGAFVSAQRDVEEEKMRLMSFLRTVPLFEGVDDAGIAALAEFAEVITYTDGDTILMEKRPVDGISVLMTGNVQLTRTALSGWENPVLVRRPGNILSAAGILSDRTAYAAAKSVHGQVRTVFFSRDAMRDFMKEHPFVSYNLVREEEEIIKALSFLWINAE